MEIRAAVLNLFTTMTASSSCPLFQAPLTTNKLHMQMYLLVNLLIKLSMLQNTQGLVPSLKFIEAPLGKCTLQLRTTDLEENITPLDLNKNKNCQAIFYFKQGFFKENVRYPVCTCRDLISLILGIRFSLILGTR